MSTVRHFRRHKGQVVPNIIRLINQIERNAGSLLVREQVNGEWGNFALVDLPAHLAIRHVCRLLRSKLKYPEGVHANGSR